jgi:hypothetical protein
LIVKSVTRFALVALSLLLLGAAPEAMKFLNDGIRAAKRGDLKSAEGLIERAIAIDSREAPDYQVHFWEGVVLSALGNEAGARKEWTLATHTPEVNRRFVAMKALTPQQKAENERSDAFFLDARRTKSFQAGEEAMKAGKYEEAQALYARALSEPRPELYRAVLSRPIQIHLPPPTQTAGTTAAMTTETTATTPPTSTAPPDIFQKIKEQFANLSPGTIAFNAPDQMKVSDPEQVTVRIAPKGEGAGITGGLSGQTTTSSQEHITPTMAARLDGLGFEITALTPETQLVAGGGFTEWRWSVTPTSAGDHNLNVSIIAKLEQYERVVGTETHPIHVEADPMGAVEGFFGNNWQWLASAIVIPLIALLWRSRAKNASAS